MLKRVRRYREERLVTEQQQHPTTFLSSANASFMPRPHLLSTIEDTTPPFYRRVEEASYIYVPRWLKALDGGTKNAFPRRLTESGTRAARGRVGVGRRLASGTPKRIGFASWDFREEQLLESHLFSAGGATSVSRLGSSSRVWSRREGLT